MAGTEPAAHRHARQSRAPRAPVEGPQESPALVVTFTPSVAPDALAALCDELRSRLEAARLPPLTVTCDVAAVGTPDLGTVDALARVALTARRYGADVSVVGSTEELYRLVALVGLAGVIACPEGQSSRAGRPKSGKNVSVSRKNVIPAMPSSDRSST